MVLNLRHKNYCFSNYSDTTIGPNFNAFTEKLAEITSGTTVTVEATGNFDNRATGGLVLLQKVELMY